jgi:hypothetical protein
VQFLAPGAGLPEHGQGVVHWTPLAAGAKQLGGEHQPGTPLAFAQGLQLRRGGSAQGGGEGAVAVRLAEGVCEALEILLTRNSPMLALLRGRDGSRVAGAG